MATLLIWDDLPDARDEKTPNGGRCTVRLMEQCLAHIVQRHIATRDGPWEEWLSEEICDRLTRWYQEGAELDNETLKRLQATFGDALRESLTRPLVLLTRLNRRQHAWIAVVPHGAVFVLSSESNRVLLITCYYPDRVSRYRRDRRWLAATHYYLLAFCPIKEVGGAKLLLLPEDENIRFVQPESWGFDTSARLPVWRGALPEWPAAEMLSPTTRRPRIKLRQRRWTLPDSLEDSENGKHSTTTK
jgi:hypothetical protein